MPKLTDDELKQLKAEDNALNDADEWAGAGNKCLNIARDVAKSNLTGQPFPATDKIIATTISGAVKLFLDGNIKNQQILANMKKNGLDLKSLRSDLVERTMTKAIPQIVNDGDIERLARLGALAGEVVNPVATGNTTVPVRYITPDEIDEANKHIDEILNNESNDD